MAGSESARKRTHYDLLGVPPHASADQIAAAYRACVRLHHPDVSVAADAEATMVRLNDAFAVLRDPERRAAYDLSLRPPVTEAEREPYPDDAEWRPPRRPSFDLDDLWPRGAVPDFARAEQRRQNAVRELRAYWRRQTEAAPLGFVEKLAMMLVLPAFLLIVFLVARLFH